MKTLSLIGMILGLGLIAISTYNYFSMQGLFSGATAANLYYFVTPGLIGCYLFIFSAIVSRHLKIIEQK